MEGEEEPHDEEPVPKSISQGIIDNDENVIEEILNDETEINLNDRDEDGQSLIDLAVILGRCEILEKLILKCDNTTILSNSSGMDIIH